MGSCISKKYNKQDKKYHNTDMHLVKKHKNINELKKETISLNKNHKHLVCDDIYVNRLALGKYLTRFGYEYDEAINGLDAIEKIKSNGTYDIIWIDIKMPKMDGIECTKMLRTVYEYKGKIIGLTGFVDKITTNKCLKNGMDNVMHKPLNKKIISMYINEIEDKDKKN